MKIIMLATDGSDSANEALEFAVEMCRETRAALEIVAVKPRDAAGRGGTGPKVLEIESREGAEHIVGVAAETAAAAGVVATPHVRYGKPIDEIEAAAVELGVDLIVVGSRGPGATSGASMGSVSRGLALHSRVAVTIVRAPAHDRAHA